jgi:inner membrane protein
MKDLLSNSVIAKVLLLVLLTLLATLPLGQINGLIQERGSSRERAAHELATAHAGAQVLAGPLMVVPYTERWTVDEKDDKGNFKGRANHQKLSHHVVYPEKSVLEGKLTPQERYRGIFTVLFYDLKGSFRGHFAPFDPATLPHTEKASTIEMQPPVLGFALSDIRGLQGAPTLALAGAAGRWQPRIPGMPEDSWLSHGVHAPLPEAALQAWNAKQPLEFRMGLTVVGQERLSIVPLADENTARLTSDWPHPSFGGEFLALRRTVSERGFEAQWEVSSLVSAARTQLLRGTPKGHPRGDVAERLDSFDVSLVEPLNVYAMSSRAVKYGLLFVALTFMAAFMFELFRKLRLHPVQYGLVGLSITVFFLLLLALSEKIDFLLAYGIAAGASVLLLTIYFSAVLQGWRRGLGLGAFVAVLYAALYGLLSSEDNALLLGSLLLFGLLGLMMIATRRVDWYALSAPRAPQPEPQPDGASA